MRIADHLVSFFAGLGVGIAAAALFAPEAGAPTRNRIRGVAHRASNQLRENSTSLGDAARDILEATKSTQRDDESHTGHTLSDVKDNAKQKIDHAARVVQKATDQAAHKAKDLAHQAGEAIEERGKRLQNA